MRPIDERWKDWYAKSLYGHKPAWMRFLRDWFGKEIYLREAAFLSSDRKIRAVVESNEKFHRQMLYYTDPKRGKQFADTYMSVFEFGLTERRAYGPVKWVPVWSSAKITRSVCDFDRADNMEWAHTEAIALIRDRDHIFPNSEYRLVFTGGKGYQVHEISPEGSKWIADAQSLRRAQEAVTSGFETLDRSLLGDLTRVVRIPNALHRSGRRAIWVKDINRDHKDILDESESEQWL